MNNQNLFFMGYSVEGEGELSCPKIQRCLIFEIIFRGGDEYLFGKKQVVGHSFLGQVQGESTKTQSTLSFFNILPS